jgi:transposase InsO family protein
MPNWASNRSGNAHKRTHAYRPQTNGKIERFHRTMASESAFARHYPNKRTRRSALTAWLHLQHRQHSAIGKVPPFTRLTKRPWAVQLASVGARYA